MSQKPEYRGALAQSVRIHMGYTQKEMADFLGMTLPAWQKKEQGENRVSVAEYQLFLLLIGAHPNWTLVPKLPDEKNKAQLASEAAIHLGTYLAGRLVLPTKAKLLESELIRRVDEFTEEWKIEVNRSVEGLLPQKPD
ncbi:helix-turn-helix transcriptional regulator [Dickeya sp. NCPPB 3274]|uniref:helix-turn-helix domain-containing protein n=1 Tax=Dickeya sp. NCPPB 3274 TaxID=568766 RepID=UPI0006ACD3FC|nr:helix-turn-helix transcriptional regulator [Dickeya sp. NCPPB 3274]